MKIYYNSSFMRQYKKLPQKIQLLLALKEDIFRVTPFHPSLQTHKLHGLWGESYSFSVDRKLRVIFDFDKNGNALFHNIGGHDIYR